MTNDHECRTFVDLLVVFLKLCQRLWDIVGSFLAISEVILVIPDVGLDNFLKFDKKSANNILQNRFLQSARLKKSFQKMFGKMKTSPRCPFCIECLYGYKIDTFIYIYMRNATYALSIICFQQRAVLFIETNAPSRQGGARTH